MSLLSVWEQGRHLLGFTRGCHAHIHVCLNPYPSNIFCLENVFLFASTGYIQLLLKLDLFKEANTMYPDQSDLGPDCLQYMQQMIEKIAKVAAGGERNLYQYLVSWLK